jgi:outer membrane protein OmpA-like peptidoglycan-associated protein
MKKSIALRHCLSLAALAVFPTALPAQETAGEKLEQVVKQQEVYFDFGSHQLLPAADSVLQAIAALCKGRSQLAIRVTAHTDSIGTLTNNQALSERRALAVKKALERLGLPAASMSVATFGESTPAAGNETAEGRQRNRRATIEVLERRVAVRLSGTVRDETSGTPLKAWVVLRTQSGRDSMQTDDRGYFSKTYPANTVVGIDVYATCYFPKSDMMKAVQGMKPLEFPMRPAAKGAVLDIENLYFQGGLPILLDKSKPELPKLLHFMQLNPQMKIEIAGHVNVPNQPPVPPEDKDFKLSVARAKTVHDYLLANGIEQKRIQYRGYGNSQMRFPNAVSEREQALNRRVELRVLENPCQ